MDYREKRQCFIKLGVTYGTIKPGIVSGGIAIHPRDCFHETIKSILLIAFSVCCQAIDTKFAALHA